MRRISADNKIGICLNIRNIKICVYRPGGLAHGGLTLNVLRGTDVHVRTALSARLLPPLRQTALTLEAMREKRSAIWKRKKTVR